MRRVVGEHSAAGQIHLPESQTEQKPSLPGDDDLFPESNLIRTGHNQPVESELM